MSVGAARSFLLLGALVMAPGRALADPPQERRSVYAAVLEHFARRHPKGRYDILMVHAASVTDGWRRQRAHAAPEPDRAEPPQPNGVSPPPDERVGGVPWGVLLEALDQANAQRVDLRADLEGIPGVLVDTPGAGWPAVARVTRRATLCCGCVLCLACPPLGAPLFLVNQLELLPFQVPPWLAAAGVGSRRHLALSNVGFNAEGTMAAVFVELDPGFEPSGNLVILKRTEDGRWEVVESQMLWIV